MKYSVNRRNIHQKINFPAQIWSLGYVVRKFDKISISEKLQKKTRKTTWKRLLNTFVVVFEKEAGYKFLKQIYNFTGFQTESPYLEIQKKYSKIFKTAEVFDYSVTG